ncbi:hypothetical protein QBC43DRAFT_316217 [Cladorrhinum sp. PSN259]|nr:hypothetical protein QBC43DRAFT_316217 [Cladorrhinum sp. PSN259]
MLGVLVSRSGSLFAIISFLARVPSRSGGDYRAQSFSDLQVWLPFTQSLPSPSRVSIDILSNLHPLYNTPQAIFLTISLLLGPCPLQ